MIIVNVVQIQQLPEVEKRDPEKMYYLKRVIYNGRRKICMTFKIDTGTAEMFVYRYRNKTYVKNSDIRTSVLEYEHFLQKTIYILSYFQIFSRTCIGTNETTHHNPVFSICLSAD